MNKAKERLMGHIMREQLNDYEAEKAEELRKQQEEALELEEILAQLYYEEQEEIQEEYSEKEENEEITCGNSNDNQDESQEYDYFNDYYYDVPSLEEEEDMENDYYLKIEREIDSMLEETYFIPEGERYEREKLQKQQEALKRETIEQLVRVSKARKRHACDKAASERKEMISDIKKSRYAVLHGKKKKNKSKKRRVA